MLKGVTLIEELLSQNTTYIRSKGVVGVVCAFQGETPCSGKVAGI